MVRRVSWIGLALLALAAGVGNAATVTCEAGDVAPCNISYEFGQGNSNREGGAKMQWFAFKLQDDPLGGTVLVDIRLVDNDGVSRRFSFTPDGIVDFSRSLDNVGEWMNLNGVVYGTVGTFPSDECPTCVCEQEPEPVEPPCQTTSILGENYCG